MAASTAPIEKAARWLRASGVVVVVSAGNQDADADSKVPSCVAQMITVGATMEAVNHLGNSYDTRMWHLDQQAPANSVFSNYGHEVDVFAPGFNVRAADWLGDFGSFRGTSFAAPLVSGVAVQYMQANPQATPVQVQDWIKANATPDRIGN